MFWLQDKSTSETDESRELSVFKDFLFPFVRSGHCTRESLETTKLYSSIQQILAESSCEEWSHSFHTSQFSF